MSVLDWIVTVLVGAALLVTIVAAVGTVWVMCQTVAIERRARRRWTRHSHRR